MNKNGEQMFSSYFASLFTEEDNGELPRTGNIYPHVLGKELVITS